jgi:hypothetical protein
MTDHEITLPPLPLPDHAGPNGTGTYFSAWTETQVRDAQRAAVLLDRQQRDKPAPSAMQVGCEGTDGLLRIHAESETCDVCAPPAPSAEPVESQLVMLARILRCRYPVDKSIRSNGFDWDISRLNEVVAELHLTAPSAEPFSPKEIALMNEKWLHRKALGLAEAAPSAEPVITDAQVAAAERELWMGGMRDVPSEVVRLALIAACRSDR